jgi:hypothetical protein
MYCLERYEGLWHQVVPLGRSHRDLPKLMAVRPHTSWGKSDLPGDSWRRVDVRRLAKTRNMTALEYSSFRVKLVRFNLCDAVINNIISSINISLDVLFNPTSGVLRMNQHYIMVETWNLTAHQPPNFFSINHCVVSRNNYNVELKTPYHINLKPLLIQLRRH